jgi:hypothetical protein
LWKETSLIWVALLSENTERGTTGYGIQETKRANQKDQPETLDEKGGQDTVDARPGNVTEVTEKTVHSATDFLIAYATPEGITSMSCCQLLATCNLYYPWRYYIYELSSVVSYL